MTGSKSRILSGSALLALTLSVAMAAPAAAQDTAAPGASASAPGVDQQAPGAEGAESGDIVVTARKRAEDIQTVPIAITAYTAQDLAERNISNLNDLGNTTPGLAITSITGGTLIGIFVRGLAPANTANDLNVDANVGVFIDGIYQTSRNTIDIISVLDVGQIEIAKGPQSALYGRSTFAGALGISTRRPSRQLEATASVTAGTDEDYRVRASVSGPLGEMFAARIGGGYVTYDGYGKNAAAPKDNLGGFEKYAVDGSIEFTPAPNFTARLTGILTHSQNELSPTTQTPLSAFNCGTQSTSPLTPGVRQLYCGELPVNRTSSLSKAPDTTSKNRQVSLDVSWDFGPATLVSTTGYTNSNNKTYNDYDGTSDGVLLGVCTGGPACIGVPAYSRLTRANALSTSIEKVHTFSQELRLQSAAESRFQWMIGGNYFDSKIPLAAGGIGVSTTTPLASNERLVAISQVLNPVPTAGVGAYEFTANPFYVTDSYATQLYSSYSRSSTKSKSVFGSLGYRFGDFRINAEGRYNVDDKKAQVFSISNPTSGPGVLQPIPGTSIPAAGVFPITGPLYSRKFKSFAPRFTADFQATPDVFFYASAAKGIRSGGFNTANPANGSATGILPSEAAYDEETNWTYEAGFKSKLFDRRLLLNFSVFHIDWKDAQVSGFTQNPAATTVNRIVLNVGSIKATGFELQADLKLTDVFTVGGNFSYSDPRFQKGVYDGGTIAQCVVGVGTAAVPALGCPAVVVVTRANGTTAAVPSLNGLRPQRSVTTQWNLHAVASIPVNDDWKVAARVDVNHSGSAYSNLINTISFGSRTLTNLRVAVESDRYSLAVFANNVFDKGYVQNSINQPRIGAPFAFNIPEIYLGEGRRVGVTGTFKY